jgi:hypothetical protein
VYSQQILTHSKIDSLVAVINNSKKLRTIIDTGSLRQSEIQGTYRNCFTFDGSSDELRAFSESVTLDKTYNSTVTAYYFYQSQLIKVEIFDIGADYKRYNSHYLYYIGESNGKKDGFQSNELQKLKYLKLSAQIVKNFKGRGKKI